MRSIQSLFVLVALTPGLAQAATYVGSDLGGADLVLADGDTVEGVFSPTFASSSSQSV